MKRFGERLVRLRKEKKLTQKDIADILNISRSAYAGYEIGRRVPEYSTLEKLANLFDVPIDFLVGRSDSKQPIAFTPSDSFLQAVHKNAAVIAEIAGKYSIDLTDPVKRKQVEDIIKIIATNYQDNSGT